MTLPGAVSLKRSLRILGVGHLISFLVGSDSTFICHLTGFRSIGIWWQRPLPVHSPYIYCI